MNSKFPIIISVSFGSVLWSLFKFTLFGSILAFWVYLFFQSFLILFVAMAAYMVYCLYYYYQVFGHKLTLTEDDITYITRKDIYTFLYQDIEKVGYYTLYRPSGRSGHFSAELRLFLRSVTDPVRINMNVFSQKSMLLFLHTLLEKDPKVQVGDNLKKGLTTGEFPRKMSMWGNREDETNFGPAPKA